MIERGLDFAESTVASDIRHPASGISHCKRKTSIPDSLSVVRQGDLPPITAAGIAKRKKQGIADVTKELRFHVPKAIQLVATRGGEGDRRAANY